MRLAPCGVGSWYCGADNDRSAAAPRSSLRYSVAMATKKPAPAKRKAKAAAKRPIAKKAVRRAAAQPKALKPAAKGKRKAVATAPVQGLTLAVTGYVAPEAPPPALEVKRELAAPRDIARLLRYGEQFGNLRIEVRWLAAPLPVPSGGFALVDPTLRKSQRVLDRKVTPGTFRCMLAVAVGGEKEKLAAVVVHCGRPPIARWTVAHFAGAKPPATGAALPTVSSTSGWLAVQDASSTAAVDDAAVLPAPVFAATAMSVERRTANGLAVALPVKPGDYTAYWGVDEHDKAVCLVIDFDVFSQKDWRSKPR